MKNYYVYTWKNPETNEFFYIGKGKNKRAWSPHSNYRCGYKLKALLKRGHNINNIVNIFKNNLTEIQALKIEDKLIKRYKRIEDGGTLLNYALNGARISSKKKKQIDPITLKDIKNLYEIDKFSAAEISKKYNVCSTTILRWLRNNNVIIRPNSLPKKSINNNEQKVINMYKRGIPVFKIGNIYKVSSATVFRVLKRNNVFLKGRRIRFSSTKIKKIIKEYQAGFSSKTIAEKYNVRCCTILRTLRENNIVIRNNSEAQKCFRQTK